MPKCGYCDCEVPSQRFKTKRHKKEIIFLCTDGGMGEYDPSCYSKWKHLKTAQRAALDVLHIAKDCKLGVCEKSIKNTFHVNKMRELVASIMERIKNSARRILRKSTTAIRKLLYRLKTLANIVGLETQYQQIRTALA